MICKRKHRAIIINPVEYKGPANRFSGMILYAVNTSAVVGKLDLEAEGWAVSWGQASLLLSLLDPPRGSEAHHLQISVSVPSLLVHREFYENGLLEGRV